MQWLEELARNPTLIALATVGGAVMFVLAILGWVRNAFGIPARIRAWLRGKPYARQDVTAFEVIREPGELLPRLFGAPPPGAFGDLDMPYTPRHPGRDLQDKLRSALDERGKLLVVAPSGYGKTREAGELVKQLMMREGYCAVLVRSEGWLDVPAAWPRELPNNRIVIVLDDLNRLLPPAPAQQMERETRDPAVRLPTYEERLARFVRYFEQTASGVRVVATARDDVDPASGVDHKAELQARMKDRLWAEFARVELSAFPDEAKRNLLRAAADAAGVPADDEAVHRCAATSDGNPRTIQANVRRCQQDGQPLQPERYTPTLSGSWEARYRAVVRRYPAAAVIYDAIGLLQSAGVALEVGRVEAAARMLCGGLPRRAWMWLPIRRASRFLQRGEINLTRTRAGRTIFAPADGQIIPSGRDLALAAHAGRLVRLFGRRGDVQALLDLAAAAYFADLKHEALAAYDRALQLDPENFNIHLALASMHRHLGDAAASARFAAEARARIPPDDHYNLACLESVCGNADAAFDHLRRAAADPDFDRDWARRDPDFEWIRDDPRFGEIIERLTRSERVRR
ncbi:MAG: hypothetical protein ACFLMY_10525 [Candidatus Brachytrichaceae bacterium NZ_4S206]